MVEDNKMIMMLSKGDRLRPQYQDFDFSNLDSKQLQWINHLSYFTKYRGFMERRFDNTGKISNDMMVCFIEQHSMKLPPRIFYSLEAIR